MCRRTGTRLGWTKEIQQLPHSTGWGLAASGARLLFPLQTYARSLQRIQNRYVEEAVQPPALPKHRLCEQPGSPTRFAGPLAQGGGFFLGFIHHFPDYPIRSRTGAQATSSLGFFLVLSISSALWERNSLKSLLWMSNVKKILGCVGCWSHIGPCDCPTASWPAALVPSGHPSHCRVNTNPVPPNSSCFLIIYGQRKP